jgi:hypothetical protein
MVTMGLCARLSSTRVAILSLSVVSWILTILQISKCSFMTTTSENRKVGLGLFSKAVYSIDGDLLGCVRYINNDFDYMFVIGRALGIITVTFSTFTVVIICLTIFFKPKLSPVLWSLARLLPVCSTLSQIFTFMVLGSEQCDEEGCSLSGTGVAAVLNVFVLSILSVMANLVSAPTNPWFVWWSYDAYAASRKTLVRRDERYGEFMPSDEAARHNAPSRTAIDVMLEMEDVNLQDEELPAPSGDEVSVHTTTSIHESIATTSTEFQQRKGLQLITFTMISLSWAVSLIGVQRCTFILIGPIGGGTNDYTGIGLYTRASYNVDEMIGCLAYPDSVSNSFDTTFQAARAFGVVTALLMTIVLLLSLIRLFTHVGSEKTWCVTRALLPLAVACQLLVFLVYRTDMCTSSPEFIECIPGGAGIIVIINIILLVGLSIFTLLMPPPSNPIFAVYRVHSNDEAHEGSSMTSSLAVGNGEARVTASTNKAASLFTLQEELGSGEDTDSDSLEDYEPKEKIIKIAPIAKTLGDVKIAPIAKTFEEPEETITISMEFTDDEKKTIKTITHPDGSKTVTTTIEEISEESESEFEEEPERDEFLTNLHRKKAGLGNETCHSPLSKTSLESVPESEEECSTPPQTRQYSHPVSPVSSPTSEVEDEANTPRSVKERIRQLEAARAKEASLLKNMD